MNVPYYLTGSTNRAIEACLGTHRIGLLATPDVNKAHVPTYVAAGAPWAADNGAFRSFLQKTPFDFDRWHRWLAALDTRGCAFAVVPDEVGDRVATAARFLAHRDTVANLGFPVAYAAQDGLVPSEVPWDDMDALFVGGSDDWKCSSGSAAVMAAARERGKWVHVGRVNTWRRFHWSADHGAHSVDGTFIAFGPDANLPRLLGWLDKADRQPSLLSATWS